MYASGVLGAVAAAFGAIEAQGRGPLRPHILVWLCLIVEQLLRERGTFNKHIDLWMRAVAQAVLSAERRCFRADGGVETATLTELWVEPGEGEDASSTHNLLYFVRGSAGDDQWLEAHWARSFRRRSTGG